MSLGVIGNEEMEDVVGRRNFMFILSSKLLVYFLPFPAFAPALRSDIIVIWLWAFFMLLLFGIKLHPDLV